MKNVNVAIIEGNLTREPEMKTLNSGATVLSFSIASNSDYKKDDEWVKDVMFLNIDVWGKYATSLNDRLAKGVTVICEGRLKSKLVETQDGSKRTYFSLTANSVQIRNRVANTGQEKSIEEIHNEARVPQGDGQLPDGDKDIPWGN